MTRKLKIGSVKVIDDTGRAYNIPFSMFIELMEGVIKEIARKTAQEVIRDQKDCG